MLSSTDLRLALMTRMLSARTTLEGLDKYRYDTLSAKKLIEVGMASQTNMQPGGSYFVLESSASF